MPRKAWFVAGALIWLGLLCYGMWAVWEHDNRPGAGAHTPGRWPAHSAIVPAADRPTLILRAGEDALVPLLTRGEADRNGARVFGRPLFSPASRKAGRSD